MNIKIIKRCNFIVGDVVNLGEERNERAVRLGLAEFTEDEISTVEIIESEEVVEEVEEELEVIKLDLVEAVKVEDKNGAQKKK